MQQKKLELLAPAGDWERLEMALAYGADAVYLAGNTFGMRSFAGNFSPEELRRAAKLCRERGVDLHVTCNTMPRNDEMARLPQWLELLEEAGVTAVILADVGVLALAKRYAPSVKIHISTQASIVNYQTATAWHDLGADRVILARELSLDEIAEIRAKTPNDLEIETFGHGAMCVSYSGRCLLSNYMTGRDANRGACAQPCRYQYALVEEKRPGEYFPVYEDEKGTYIMNSRDMCMIDHLPDLIRAGVDSIKIEGRNKKAFYVASVVGAYRRVLDGEPPAAVADELLAVSHRPYGTGFYFSEAEQAPAYDGYEQETMHVADVAACRDGFLYVLCRNRFAEGDELEILAPHEPSRPLIVRDLYWLSIFGPDNHDEDAPATAGEALSRATAADWEAAAVANRSCNLYRIRLAAASDGAASGTSDTSSASDMRDASNVSVMSDTCGASGGSAPCAPSLSAHVSEGSFLRKRTFRRSARHG